MRYNIDDDRVRTRKGMATMYEYKALVEKEGDRVARLDLWRSSVDRTTSFPVAQEQERHPS